MANLYLFLSIILAAKVATLAVMVLTRQRQSKERSHGRVLESPPDLEPFYCVKADLKEVNEGVFVCQMMFANQTGSSLIAPRQASRRASN